MRLFKFVDIHSHVLPCIDDGARDIAESLQIIKEAVDSGVKEMVLSPHLSFNGMDLDGITYKFESLCKVVSESSLDISLHLGAELILSPELPKWIKEDKRLTINGKGRYALIELPFFGIPMYTDSVFFELMTMGVIPIWAHPERCVEVSKDYRILTNYVDNGALLQINAGSLLGKYGREAKKTAISMVKNGLCHILASDTHRSGEIDSLLTNAFLYLEKTIGNVKAEEMAFSTPLTVVS